MSNENRVLSLDDLAGLELLHEFVPIDRCGGLVEIRELDAAELLLVYQAASVGPVDEPARLDLQMYEACKIAACMENPCLGDTVAQRITRYQEVEKLPTLVYQALNSAVSNLTNLNTQRISRLAEMIDSIPTLYRILDILARKHGWLEDLDGKTLREVELWIAFYHDAEKEASALLQRLKSATEG